MSRPEDNDLEYSELIDRHLAGVLRPDEVERVEHLIRTSPAWAQRYKEAEDLAQLMRQGLGDGAPAPQSVKDAIHSRAMRPRGVWPASLIPDDESRRPWYLRPGVAVAALALLAVGVLAFTMRPDLMPVGFPDEPLALKDLARRSSVAFEATTVMRDDQVRVRPRDVMYGEVEGRAVAAPPGLTAGHQIALFGEYDGDGMIRPVEGMRGIVHLDGVQRWEGRDRRPAESRELVGQALSERSLAATLADLEAFLADDTSRIGERAGLLFSADVTARYLGAFDFEAIVKPLVQLVLDGDKHPDVRNAAAEGLERSDRARACEVLLASMASRPMPMLQAESEDGQVVLGCLQLLRRGGTAALAPTLRMLAGKMQAPAMRKAAEAALVAITDGVNRTGPAPQVATPLRFAVDDRECIVMGGAGGQRHGLVVVFRGTERVGAFRPVVNMAIAHGFGVLVVPAGVRDLDACLWTCLESGLVATAPIRYAVHESARDDARAACEPDAFERAYALPQPDPAALKSFLSR